MGINMTATTTPIAKDICRAVAMRREAALGFGLFARHCDTRGVTVTLRKWKSRMETLRTSVAIATAANACTPIRPTNAVSIRERMGSSARVARAGMASEKISPSRLWFAVGNGAGWGRENLARAQRNMFGLPEQVEGRRWFLGHEGFVKMKDTVSWIRDIAFYKKERLQITVLAVK